MERKTLLVESLKLRPELIKMRRHIHAYPELGFQEVKTAKLISNTLKKLGLAIQEKVAKTGVVGLLRGNQKGKTVAIRADMDALPIQEQNRKKYRSKIPGLMHACGHDGKMAIALGVASLLSRIRNELKGNVKFIFQPDEEGSGGARAMIAEGVLQNPKVNCMFCVDLDPLLNTGKIGMRDGVTTANIDGFEISVIGKGGHGARLDRAIDVVMVTARVIEALHYIIPRQQHPCIPVAISIGEIHGGTASNVVPVRVTLKGTIRTFDNETRRNVLTKIKSTVACICRTYRAQYQIQHISSYPALKNDTELNDIIANIGAQLLGPKNVYSYKYPFLEGDDVSFFFQQVPGVLFSIGVGNRKKGIVYPFHSPLFDIDEDALPIGVAVLTGCVLKYLNSN